jgi:hypothetical protein
LLFVGGLRVRQPSIALALLVLSALVWGLSEMMFYAPGI